MALPGVKSGHKPKPFQRPGITLSEDLHGSKKRWVDAHPVSLKPGDILQGKGLIVSGEINENYDPRERRQLLRVKFEMKSGSVVILHDVQEHTRVRAFTEAEGEPVG